MGAMLAFPLLLQTFDALLAALRWPFEPLVVGSRVFRWGMMADRPFVERLENAIFFAMLASWWCYSPIYKVFPDGGIMICGFIFVSPGMRAPWVWKRAPRSEWILSLCREYECLWCWKVGEWYILL